MNWCVVLTMSYKNMPCYCILKLFIILNTKESYNKRNSISIRSFLEEFVRRIMGNESEGVSEKIFIFLFDQIHGKSEKGSQQPR